MACVLPTSVQSQITAVVSGVERRPAPTPKPPNLVVILADDLGVDMLSGYGEGAMPPCTPRIDGLAEQGLLFRNAWANPTCSPARAAMLTGRYGFRTGIGTPANQNNPLPLDETTLPELLAGAGYTSSCVGKWHLGGGATYPNIAGFDHFAGAISGAVDDYFSWTKVVDGVSSPSGTYVTTDTTDEAMIAMASMPEPWLLYVAYNAPHTPIHVPPAGLCPQAGCASSVCLSVGPNSSTPRRTKAMVEALDTEIGHLLDALDALDPDAYVLFMGDNGTAGMATQAPFVNSHAKGSVYEGGVNVPFVVRGPGVAHGETAALASVTDVHATFAHLAGVSTTAEDGRSLVPVLAAPGRSVRDMVYTESFTPNGFGPWTDHRRAVRDDRYKLIRAQGQADEFFDLLEDPFESDNLWPGLDASEQEAYDALLAELVTLGVD